MSANIIFFCRWNNYIGYFNILLQIALRIGVFFLYLNKICYIDIMRIYCYLLTIMMRNLRKVID